MPKRLLRCKFNFQNRVYIVIRKYYFFSVHKHSQELKKCFSTIPELPSCEFVPSKYNVSKIEL